MGSHNEAKAKKLGMPFGTASSQLRKALLFSFAQKLKLDTCFQCADTIENIDQFSIEHKVPWFNSQTPIESFFDLSNIAFSHISCNVRAAARSNKKYCNEQERSRESFKRYYDNDQNRERFLRKKRERYRQSKV